MQKITAKAVQLHIMLFPPKTTWLYIASEKRFVYSSFSVLT